MSSEVKYYPFYIGGVKQVYPNVHPGTPKYASAVVVDNLVFLSDMTAQDTETGACLTDTIADQMVVCLDKVRPALGFGSGYLARIELRNFSQSVLPL